MSEPSASGTIPDASAQAAPPLEPPGGPGRVDRVEGGAEDRVEGVRAGGELRHVGLADHHDARTADPLDDQLVGAGHVVGVQRRAVRRAPAGHRVGVLERERQPVQRAHRGTRGQRLVGGRAPARARSSSSETIALSSGLRSAIRARCRSSSSRAEIAAGTADRGRLVDAAGRVRPEQVGDHRRPPAAEDPADDDAGEHEPGADRDAREEVALGGGARGLGGCDEDAGGGLGRRHRGGCSGRSGAAATAGAAPLRTASTLPKNSPAIRRDTEVSIRWPTPPTMPPTTASASYVTVVVPSPPSRNATSTSAPIVPGAPAPWSFITSELCWSRSESSHDPA